MNCFERVVKDFKREQRKRKINSTKSIVAFAVLGIVIGGAITVLFAEKCCEEIDNIVIKNEDIDEDININRGEIKDIMENVDDESIGDTGMEMKKSLEDLEE